MKRAYQEINNILDENTENQDTCNNKNSNANFLGSLAKFSGIRSASNRVRTILGQLTCAFFSTPWL